MKPTLPAPEGFRACSRSDFWAVVGKSPGYGRIINQYERGGRGYITHHLDGPDFAARVIAVQYSGDFPHTSDFNQRHYFLPENQKTVVPDDRTSPEESVVNKGSVPVWLLNF